MITEDDKLKIAAIIEKTIGDRFDKLVSRLINIFASAIVLFLFIMAGGFAYTTTVNDKAERVSQTCEQAKDDLDALERDMGTVSGKMKEEYPENIIIRDMHARYSTVRGNTPSPTD